MTLSFSALVLAQAAPAGGGGFPFIMIGLMMAAMYFLMIAPQRKKQKLHDAMVKALKAGDEIVTAGGIFGTVTGVKEDRVVVRISETGKIELLKSSVQTVLTKKEETK